MALKVILLVQGDNLPFIEVTLVNSNGQIMNVSGAVVKLYLRAYKTTTVISTILCAPVTDGTDGKVKFSFPGGTLNIPPGQYEGEIEVDFNGLKQTIYEILRFRVRAQFAG